MNEEVLQQWNYGRPLLNCSNNVLHNNDCNGNCGNHPATKGQVDLHNEIAKWAAEGVAVAGKPAIIADQIARPGFSVEILSTDKRLESLNEFLYAKGIIDEEEFMEFHRLRFTAFLKEARNTWELEKAKASIVIPHVGPAKLPGDGHLH